MGGKKHFGVVTAGALIGVLVCGSDVTLAQDAGYPSTIRPAEKEYSPYLNHNYPDQVFFGS